MSDYKEKFQTFRKTYCCGKEYDSCVKASCPYLSSSGCKHPQHPKNASSVKK